MKGFSTKKAEARAVVKVERANMKTVPDLRLACFWTWPWGHVWGVGDQAYTCQSCGGGIEDEGGEGCY